MSERLVGRITEMLGRLENGWEEDEVISTLGLVLTEDHRDDVLGKFPPERREILLAGFDAALIRVADEDRLEAPPSALTGYPLMAMHELGLAKHLLDALKVNGPGPLLSAIYDPSFEMPWAVRIERTPLDRRAYEYQLIHTTIREGTCKFADESVDVVRHEIPVGEDLARRLESLWERMLSNIRPRSLDGIADGVIYRFANPRRAGQTHSPKPHSLPWRLAGVAHALAKLATSDPDARAIVLDELHGTLDEFGR